MNSNSSPDGCEVLENLKEMPINRSGPGRMLDLLGFERVHLSDDDITEIANSNNSKLNALGIDSLDMVELAITVEFCESCPYDNPCDLGKYVLFLQEDQ